MFLVGFGHQSQTVQVDVIRSGQELFPQTVNPRERGPILVMDLIAYSILVVKRFRSISGRVGKIVFHNQKPPYQIQGTINPIP